MIPIGTELNHACPECGGVMVLRNSKFGLFYGCRNFPDCRAAHGAHPDGTPLGIPADKPTKVERCATHVLFDRLWRGSPAFMSRYQAYAWMQKMMGLSPEEAHIGRFTMEDCARFRALLLEHFPSVRDPKPGEVAYDGLEPKMTRPFEGR